MDPLLSRKSGDSPGLYATDDGKRTIQARDIAPERRYLEKSPDSEDRGGDGGARRNHQAAQRRRLAMVVVSMVVEREGNFTRKGARHSSAKQRSAGCALHEQTSPPHRSPTCTPTFSLHTDLQPAHRPSACTPSFSLHTDLPSAHRPPTCTPSSNLHAVLQLARRPSASLPNSRSWFSTASSNYYRHSPDALASSIHDSTRPLGRHQSHLPPARECPCPANLPPPPTCGFPRCRDEHPEGPYIQHRLCLAVRAILPLVVFHSVNLTRYTAELAAAIDSIHWARDSSSHICTTLKDPSSFIRNPPLLSPTAHDVVHHTPCHP
ncbi:hypothetical protein BDY19DRAFT_998890 [Irpex rosettiformis]|uniref:Uncharacterized protein n=1 Tax=Irpex rosettiformis TaxID=378272 RepID=A0ACB8TM06_9APHY|nr:hypothetical protein BDY19DRAFT_998890 [Irpex rosettiformis]